MPECEAEFDAFHGFILIKIELSGKTVYDPVLKTTQLSAHAQNHANPERCRKPFIL